ncbi:MAG: TIGR02147 family protein [Bdellovibrionota bacterium]
MDVYQYLDPYIILQHYYQLRKKYEPGFSYTVWAVELNLKSSSTLRMMVTCKKRLSTNVSEKFVEKSLKSENEKNYFRMLVVYAHAPTPQVKNAAWSAMSKILTSQIQKKEVSDYVTYVSDLLLPKLQTILSFDDQAWTKNKLALLLKEEPAKIQEALEKLASIRLVEPIRTETNKVFWRSTEGLVTVSNKLGDVALKNYHNACLDEAKSAQNLPTELRRYQSLLLPLNPEEFQNMNDEIETFVSHINSKYCSNSSAGRRIFKLNMNYFPVTQELTETQEKSS